MRIFLLLPLFLFPVVHATAQNQYQVIPDAMQGKILKGVISRELLEKDTTFGWFDENKKGYAPYASAVSGLKKNADSLQLVVFMGTWCDDSHFIIPKFFLLLDAAGFPADHVSLIAVDHDKSTTGHLSQAFHITNVPTIIVMRNGKEEGRVIEYGKSGLFDKDLGEIIH